MKKEKDWYKYEKYCINYHQHKYEQITWHWENIPEEHLFKSNIISNFKKTRLQRKKNKEDGVVNTTQEYGLDGLALDKNNNYHGLQMKYWKSKNKLTAEHLGTFFLVSSKMNIKNNASKSYLYHTCKLHKEMEELMKDT